VISAASSQVAVRAIRRDEESMIAKTVCRVKKEMCHEYD
jgi:acetate kinase